MEHIKTVQLTFTGQGKVLDDMQQCERLLDALVLATKLTKLESVSHRFTPQGISIIYLLSESHIAIHTWPEDGYGYITVTTCNTDSFSEDTLVSVLGENNLEVIRIGRVA